MAEATVTTVANTTTAAASFEFFSKLDRWIDQIVEKIRPRTLPQRILWWTSAAGVTYYFYWNFYGRMARRRRKDLEEKLRQVQLFCVNLSNGI